MYNILIIDECTKSIDIIVKALPCHYKRQFALSAEESLEMIKNNISVPDIILIGSNEHGLDGFDLCRRLKNINKLKDIPIMLISSLESPQYIVKAFEMGAVDYIKRPFNIKELLARLEGHLKNSKIDRELKKQNISLIELSSKRTKDIMKSQMAIIYALAKLSEIRDSYTGSHLERVAYISGLLAERYMKSSNEKKINDEYINILKQASMLHDIGKVGISDSILNKNSKLSEEEFNIIKLHTVIGSTTIKSVYNEFPDNTFLRMAEEIARYHHEKWNGQGYPEGLKELQIPLSARIVSLADTYDALRTERPYKKSMSHKETINIIKRGRGESFDPLLVDLFIDAKGEIEQLYCDNNKIDEAI